MRNRKILLGLVVFISITSTNIFAAELGVATGKTELFDTPSEEGNVVGYLLDGESYEIKEEVEGYYKLVINEGETAYTKKDFIEVEETEEVDDESSSNEESDSSKGEEVVAFAKQYIGTPYVFGGNSLTKGVDCSGFVKQVFLNFDVELERTSRSQFSSNGSFVSRDELVPGDLVFYGYDSVSHVAIYIGDDNIIHAPVPGKSVCTAPIHQRGDAPIMGYKRVI